MKIEVLKNEGNTLEVILVGEDHTFANVLRQTLKKDEHVVFAAYKIEHPLVSKERPTLMLETDGKETPKEALVKAAQRIREQVHEFGEKL